MIKKMKTTTITKGQIVIPKEIRKDCFKEGSKVVILAFNDRIELRPPEYIEEKLGCALLSEAV
ncbi:MAG: AbrB/MazE/SpoVT family DNA-binding domain-containing protein, partial [Candidatus Nanoarchaeia archaeon]